MKLKFTILTLVIAGAFVYAAAPALALEPLVPCGRSVDDQSTSADETRQCATCDFLVLGKNVSDFILFYLVPGIAALLFIYAGFLILLGGAMPSKVVKGRTIFQNTAYGLVIIFLAWLIVNTTLRTVARDENISDRWWKLECREPVPKAPASSELTISDVTTGEITDTTADITWTTSKNSTSQVEFSDSFGKSRTSELDSNTTMTHMVVLSGLNPNTSYSVFAKSKDSSGNEAKSSAVKFKTLASEDGEETVLLSFITDTNLPDAVINQPYSVKLAAKRGKTPYTFSVEGGDKNLPVGLKMTNDGTISGTPTKIYDGTGTGENKNGFIFLAQVEDSSDPKVRVKNNFYIKIIAKSSPVVISAATSKNIMASAVTIVWTTDKPATTQVEYGTGTAYGMVTILDTALKTSHNVTISRLSPDTTYHFRALSRASGYTAKSADIIAKTTASGARACKYTGVNLCQPSPTACSPTPSCSAYSDSIKKAAGSTAVSGVNMTALIRSIMYKESSCNVAAKSNSSPPSCGLMQLQPATANRFKAQCGVSADVTCDWLRSSANAEASICMGAKFLKSIALGTCGTDIRNIAAGYNAGPLGPKGACADSKSCAGDKSCDGENVKRWECLYENTEHTTCNTGYDETRGYAPKVSSCYNANNR